jgi:thiol-disulfide isomerase/thioredoxin
MQTQGQILPFNLEIEQLDGQKYRFSVLNADHKMEFGVANIESDSIIVPLSIFDASLAFNIESSDRLTGVYIKHDAEKYQIPVTAKPSSTRFEVPTEEKVNSIEGKWELTITEKNGRQIPAIGSFSTDAYGKLTGTIITSAGDYRFLEGYAMNDELRLSTFDGAHAYLFHAQVSEDQRYLLEGEFWSGKGGYRTFSAYKNPDATLRNLAQDVYLKEGFEKIAFSFPNEEGKLLSLSDQRFEDKAVILQIFGTWCPNCMDETNFLSEWYEANKDRGVEIIALAYEVKDDFEYASKRIKRVKERLGANYSFVVAGTNNEASLSASLPMLSKIPAYPTMIFLDQEKKIQHIHTGFTGPGTGIYYDEFVEEFNQIMDGLLGI